MTIAELFVNLGIKGDGTANKALKGVKGALGEVKSMSLEAKAAIVGVVYGLEKLMSASAQQGTNLTNFNALTGLSTQSLQEWQYAARQAGVSSEELTGSVKGIQQAMTNMLLGKGAPEGMAMLANKVGFDQKRARDTFYVMQKMQEFAKSAPADVTSQMLKTFGASEGVIAAMQRNSFRPEVMAKAPKYSTGEVNQLQKVDVAWSNLGNKIQMAMGHFTSKHGMQLVGDLSKVVNEVVKLADAFMKLAETVKLFQGIGKVFEGWTSLFKGITAGVSTLTDAFSDDPKKQEKAKKQLESWGQGASDFSKGVGITLKEALVGPEYEKLDKTSKISPAMSPMAPSSSEQNINNIINMNFQHDGKDHKKTGDSVQKAIEKSYRQKSAQGQGS